MNPQLDLYQYVRRKAIEVLGEQNVYDYIPGEGTKYPFFYIGEQYTEDKYNKSIVVPEIEQTVHYYMNNHRKKGTAIKHINELIRGIRSENNTRYYYIKQPKITTQIIEDNTTDTPLLHGVIRIRTSLY